MRFARTDTRLQPRLIFLPLIGLAACACYAQDLRKVTEPTYPRVSCVTLAALLEAPAGVLSDVAEKSPDTARIQNAIDACPAGQAVELKPAPGGNVFLTGPLHLKAGVTLLIGRGAAVFGSRNPRDYDTSPGSCGVVDEKGHGCQPLILADRAPGAAIMGDGAIDGRGGAALIGQKVSWWDLAHDAKVRDLQQSCPRILVVRQSDGFVLYRITLKNSPNFHVSIDRTNGFTAWGVKIRTPKTARNTDGIDPASSTNVTITQSWIATGDDNVAIKAGNTGPATHMTIAHNHFYSGHGMSIGSETNGGVSDIQVTDLSIDGADNGIRIKSDRSRGGLVEHVTYNNVCMRDVKNPIFLTPRYTTKSGNELPVYRDITLTNVHSVTPGKTTMEGLDADHPVDVRMGNVAVDRQKPADVIQANAHVFMNSVGAPLDCNGRFPPFPDDPGIPAAAQIVPPEDRTLYVAADGSGDFSSIQRAIDAAPPAGATFSIAPGTYREVLNIDKPGLILRGARDDPRSVRIVFDKSAGTSGGTFNSATVNVKANDFRAENLTFANDFNATHPQLPQGSQALALSLTGDRAVLHNVRLLGNQDTLYSGGRPAGRSYFSDCYIEGNVDFIFGNGKMFFENCEIHSTAHSEGFITAQGKNTAAEDSLFVFDHCRLTAEAGVKNVWLGRPWRPYAAVVFLNTEMGAHITPQGWREWHPGETSYLNTVDYAEYNSTGTGAPLNMRDPHTRQLTANEAAQYSVGQVLGGSDGWDPTRPAAHPTESAAADSPAR